MGSSKCHWDEVSHVLSARASQVKGNGLKVYPRGWGFTVWKILLTAELVGAGMGAGHHRSHPVPFHPSAKAKLAVRTRLMGTTPQCQHHQGT